MIVSLSRHLRRQCLHKPSFFAPSPINPSATFPLFVLSTPHRNHHYYGATRPAPFPRTALLFRSFSWHSTSRIHELEKGERILDDTKLDSASEITDLGLGGVSAGAVSDVVGDESLWDVPVHSLISLLDGYHDLTGLPWWIIIATSTLALRLSLIPLLILQFKKLGKLSQLFPKLPPPLPPPFSGVSFREQFSLHRRKRKELGCPSYLWSFVYAAVQLPCFLLWMTSIRRMCLSGHPGFDTGGALWFDNLTEFSHGVYSPVFPVLIAGLHFINVQVSFKTFKTAKLPGFLGLLARYYKLYLDILSLPLLVIGFYIPQGSLIYWTTNSSLTLIQQLTLRNTNIRKKLGLPDINDRTQGRISPQNHLHDKKLSADKHFSVNSLLQEKNIQSEHDIDTDIESLSPEKLLEQGLQHLTAGHHDKALHLIRLATEKDPELVKGLIAMGQILCSQRSLAEAAQYFERAISKIQEEEEEEVGLLVLASFGAGVSHIWQGKQSEGIEHLKRISNLKEPEAPMDKACYYQGLVMLGSTLFQEGEKSEAVKYLRRAATYDPNVKAYVKECEEELRENK